MKMVIVLQRMVFKFKTTVLTPKLNKQFKEKEALLRNSVEKDWNEYSFEMRKKLIVHAAKNSEYYKNLFLSTYIDVSDIEAEEDFQKIPILTREDIRINFDDICSNTVSKRFYNKVSTSGTTGAPISVLHDNRFSLAPLQWRILKWWGLHPFENKAFIYRHPRSLLKRVVNTLLWWPTRRIFLAGTVMTAKSQRTFAKKINRYKPNLLQGYVDVVYEFALYLYDNNLKIHAPKAVWVTAGPLFPYQRKLMEQVFHAPVYDQYGSTEVMMISAECKEQKGLHIMSDTVFIEFLDEENNPVEKGDWGKIVLTDLNNYAFPIIRYEIGDYGRLLPCKCKCGLNLPLMDQVRVRKAFLIKTLSGLELDILFLSSLFDEYPEAVRLFQFEQKFSDSIFMYYIPNNYVNIEDIIAKVVTKIREKANNELNVIPKRVMKAYKVNGKVPFVINATYNLDVNYVTL